MKTMNYGPSVITVLNIQVPLRAIPWITRPLQVSEGAALLVSYYQQMYTIQACVLQ